jgi:hypothetical protein
VQVLRWLDYLEHFREINMSKVFKRPMFRKGGQVNEGIMTGIVDRENHAEDPFVGGTDQFPYMAKSTESSPQMNLPDLKSMTKENIDLLLEAAGPRGGFDPVTQFLLEYGPEAATKTGGGTFANLISAAKKPIESLIAGKQREDDFLRSIRTQATGAAMKQRSELEASERDRLFKTELADKQAELNRELSNAEILAAKERADAKYLQDLELQSKKSQADYETRSKLLKEADLLEQKTTGEKIQEYTPSFAEEYDNDFTKGNRRAKFEFETRQQIATKFGESKVGGHIDVDIGDEKQLNKVMKRKIKAGGSQKIYYNVNDGKAYLLTEQGLQPVDLAGGEEQITEIIETTPGGETVKKEPREINYFSEEQKKKIKELSEEAKEIPFGGFGA